MTIPEPQRGLVICYAYLWHREHRAGREEGVKDRPCVITLAVERRESHATWVRVAAITHRQPEDPALAFELPPAVKRHLGPDDKRSWVVLYEVNEFEWPGYDLRPIPHRRGSFVYGLLQTRLFDRLMVEIGKAWHLKTEVAIKRS